MPVAVATSWWNQGFFRPQFRRRLRRERVLAKTAGALAMPERVPHPTGKMPVLRRLAGQAQPRRIGAQGLDDALDHNLKR